LLSNVKLTIAWSPALLWSLERWIIMEGQPFKSMEIVFSGVEMENWSWIINYLLIQLIDGLTGIYNKYLINVCIYFLPYLCVLFPACIDLEQHKCHIVATQFIFKKSFIDLTSISQMPWAWLVNSLDFNYATYKCQRNLF
jgi:hypothetical protein